MGRRSRWITVVIALAALVLSACSPAEPTLPASSAPPVTFRLAFNQGEDHPEYTAAVNLGEQLSAATEGRYKISVYPNEQLGSQADVVNQVSAGTIEMTFASGPVLETLEPDFVVYDLPYVFASAQAQAAVLADEDVNRDLFGGIASTKNVTVLGGFYAGVRSVYSSKGPVKTPADLVGVTLRSQESSSQVAMVEALGAKPLPLSAGDTFSALQTHRVDGAENNEALYHALHHDQVASYYSYTRHQMAPDYLVISSRSLAGMSPKDREAFLALIPSIRDASNEAMTSYCANAKKAATDAGAKFNDDVDITAFKEELKPFVDDRVAANDRRKKLYAAVEKANDEFPAKP